MFEKEEKKLAVYRKKIEEIQVDQEMLNDAIQKGVQIGEKEARNRKSKRKKFFYSFAAVAILVISFVSTIRISPAFANAVASLPGMERIVELIQYDKGIEGILENDYYQPIHATEQKDDVTLTINGVILDETGMVVSYVLEAPYSIENIKYKEIRLLHDGKEVVSSMMYDNPNQKHPNRKEDLFHFIFSEPRLFEKQDFTLEIELNTKEKTVFSIPFKVPELAEEGKVYKLNKEVEIEHQKMTIDTVTIYPLRTAIQVTFDESNSMKLLHFEDMRIEDEHGEVWSKIQNGISGVGSGENTETYYLQSNYFERPEKLFLKFEKMLALPKEDAYLIVDTMKKTVLHKPSMGNFEVTNITTGSIAGRVEIEEDLPYSFFSSIENANGEMVGMKQETSSRDEEFSEFWLEFESQDAVNPLKFEFYAYPNYLYGNIEIELE